jgi:hypothetical protein
VEGVVSVAAPLNSHSASALHARLQSGTRAARESAGRIAVPAKARRRRVSDRDAWQLMGRLRGSGSLAEPTLSCDRALRRILYAMIEDSDGHAPQPIPLTPYVAPVLVIRSGPWPLLRALMDAMSAAGCTAPVTVLCHRRDDDALAELARVTGREMHPLYYPRFEPFNSATLQRVLDEASGPWAATFVLDASRTGSGHALEHVTTVLSSLPGEHHVWNASGQLLRLRTLRETLGPERYEIVRRLLRWRASRVAAGE